MAEHSPISRSMFGYQPIFERLLDDVAFLWLQRSKAADQPAYFQWDLAAMDERIHNYLRGLLQAPEISWGLFEESASVADAGYFFTAAILAFQTQNARNIKKLIERSEDTKECVSGLSSALAYLPGSLVHPWIKKFFISKDKHHQYLALLACHIRREDPRNYLTVLIQQPDSRLHENLFTCALKLAGVLKRVDLLPQLRQAMADERESVQFWAAWSCALLRDKSAVPTLQSVAMVNHEWQMDALTSLLLLLEVEPARALVDELARSDATRRHAIAGCAVLGDARALPWLLQMARLSEFNYEATQAVVTIIGIAPESDWQRTRSPESAGADGDLPLDSEEDRPFIDPDKLSAAWQQNSSRWKPGQHYFLGQPLHANQLVNLFHQANQQHRRTAALHLARLLPDRPLLNHARAELFHL